MESSAFIISGPVRMDLHFKCMLNVISKLELIETFKNVDVHPGLVEDGMCWPCRQWKVCETEGTVPPCLHFLATLGGSFHPFVSQLPDPQEE